MSTLLLFSALVVATCGLVYELVAGTLASYLLGDSVTQFSTIIGVYLFAMGLGALASKHVGARLIEVFVRVEILVGLIGGSSAALLFLLFPHVVQFRVALYALVTLVGVLVGLEIPLLIRILQDRFELSELVARVLAADYLGALIASLLFPLLLVPHLGLVRTSFLFGIVNVGVAGLLLSRPRLVPNAAFHRLGAGCALLLLLGGFAFSERIMALAEEGQYPGQALYARSTPYQRIVVTRERDDIRLFLNGNLQFSSRDEYRYHEALVHPMMATGPAPRRVLVMGGGDGLALREVLKYPSVESITLVDLDPEMTTLFAGTPVLSALNHDALRSPKLRVINADAFVWARQAQERYDVLVIDFPDPSNYSIGKLFSLTFYRQLHALLAPQGRLVIQSTSPLVAPEAFWCVNATLRAAGFWTAPYHVNVPSFGEWGFVAASEAPLAFAEVLPAGLRFLTVPGLPAMFEFPPDMQDRPVEVNRLDNQVLVQYFEHEWGNYLGE